MSPVADRDGCDVVLDDEDQLKDDAIDAVVLFADVDPDDDRAVARRVREYEELFGGGA